MKRFTIHKKALYRKKHETVPDGDMLVQINKYDACRRFF